MTLYYLPAHPHVHPQSEWAITCLCLPSRSWYSFTDPGGWKAEKTLVRSSRGRDSNPQPPDCKSLRRPSAVFVAELRPPKVFQYFSHSGWPLLTL